MTIQCLSTISGRISAAIPASSMLITQHKDGLDCAYASTVHGQHIIEQEHNVIGVFHMYSDVMKVALPLILNATDQQIKEFVKVQSKTKYLSLLSKAMIEAITANNL